MPDPHPSGVRREEPAPPSFVLGCAVVLLLPLAGLSLILEPRISLRAQLALQALFVVAVFLKLRLPPFRRGERAGMVSWLLAVAALISGLAWGALNCAQRVNDWRQWWIHGSIMAVGCFAVLAGKRVGRGASTQTLRALILVLAASEILFVIPRLAHLTGRSADGGTLWIGALLALTLVSNTHSRGRRLLPALVLGASLLGLALTGQRSLASLALLASLTTLGYVAWHRRLGPGSIALVGVAVLVVLGGWALSPPKLQHTAERLVRHVVVGTRNTLTALPEGRIVQTGGRLREANAALQAFEGQADQVERLTGVGFGFYFINLHGSPSSHVHVTPLNLWIRHGLLGLALYLALLVSVFVGLFRTFTAPSDDLALVAFVLSLTAIAVIGASITHGTLTRVLPWFVLGLAWGARDRLACDRRPPDRITPISSRSPEGRAHPSR